MRTSDITVDVLMDAGDRRQALLDDARRGLTADAKVLSPIWFYDEHGSNLFDEITRLPEYYLTRAERGLLQKHAASIAESSGADTLVELGSGTSEKTRVLLDAMAGAGTLGRYVPLDVSEETLLGAARDISDEYDGVAVHAVVGDFHRHLDRVPEGGRRLVAFLGSTIGNLDPAERRRFLFDLDCNLTCDDHLLIGVDLVKEPSRLLAAYNDANGITAAFNRNALAVLNAELDADFDPDAFEHVAAWNAEEQRIEMRLRASRAQRVRLGDLDLEVLFEQGEEVRTEISTKFTRDGFTQELFEAGLIASDIWEEPGEFLLVLARPYC